MLYLFIILAVGTTSLLWATQPVFADSYSYEDTNPAPLNDVVTELCLQPLVRTFTITDNFLIEDLDVGFTASHTYRSDVRLVLYSPQGTKVEILTEFYEYVEDVSHNYDILLDAQSPNSLNDGDDDNIAAPYYERTVRPTNSLAQFVGENANGEWRLELCDAGVGDGGVYQRSQLRFIGVPIPPTPPPDQISGLIFRDANADGVRNFGETGLSDVTIEAYTDTGLLATTKSDALGKYSLAVTSGIAVRLEFIGIPTYLRAGYHGNDSATSVTFVQSPARDINVGFHNPGQYCQAAANTQLVTTCFYYGAHDGDFRNRATTFAFGEGEGSYADVASATDALAYDPQNVTPLTTHAQTGAVWGVAYNRSNRTAYVSSFVKRHAGLGETGNPTTIYAVDVKTNSSRAWFTLDATRPDPHAGTTDWAQDFAVFDQVGKEGWGDLDIAEDDSRLYAIDLGQRQLVIIPIAADGAPGAIATVDLIAHFPSNLVGANADQCSTATDLRPFGLGVHNGVVYIGVVCSAQSTVSTGSLPIQAPTHNNDAGQRPGDATRLRGYVLQWNGDSANPLLTPVLNFPLTYDRGCVTQNHKVGCEKRYDAHWTPWVDTFPYSTFGAGQTFEAMYPQPTLSDIEFFNDDMILFLGDRFGHQAASFAASPHGSGLTHAATSSDILYACKRSDGWVVEELISGDTTCGTAGRGFVRGQERIDEYFFEDTYRALYLLHDDIGMGAGAVIPGRNEVIATVYDPVYRSTVNDTNFDGGFHWYSIDDGHWRKSVRLYDGSGVPLVEGFFQKVSGLGDIVALCDPAPVEIGNRVWLDQDRDGVQDGAEPGIANVAVSLLRPGIGPDGSPNTGDDDLPLATVQTAANGAYYFSSAPGVTSANAQYGLALQYNAAYRICLPNTSGAAQQPALKDHLLTIRDAAPMPERADWRDSDGVVLGASACVDFTVGGVGQNDHSYDFGFYQLAGIGDYVWLDADQDGQQDSNETGLGGVTVQLCDASGATLAEMVSDASGYYQFTDLPAGNYGVRFIPPGGYQPSPTDQGNDDSLDSDAPAIGVCTPLAQLAGGEDDPTWDAGFYQVIELDDWGDLPDANGRYATRATANGPRHRLVPDFYLGACVDGEGDGQPAPPGSANGDDRGWGPQLLGASRCVEGDDEDGVTFMTPLLAGSTACLRLHATQPGYVNAFSDFTGDGVLAPLLFTHQDGAVIAAPTANNAVAAGSHAYCFAVPPTTNHAGLLYSRFRLSSSGGLTAVGAAADGSPADGEVEDYVQPLACVGNFVWDDHNGNGRQEPGESGMADVTVNLLWGGLDGDLQTVADNQTFTTQTDAQGAYHFCGLLPTTTPAYQLFLPTLPGVPTHQDASNEESTDSDGDPQGRGPAFALPLPLNQPDNAANDQSYEGYADPQDDLSFDFGFYQLAAIGDYVWLDDDQDGQQDPNETGLGGVTVQLCDATGPTLAAMVTDANGYYHFTDLIPATYGIRFIPPTGYQLSPPDQGSDDSLDSDAPAIGVCTPLTQLLSDEDDISWDAGFYPVTELDDWGDLPDANGRYATRATANGPRHRLVPDFYLGACVDGEGDGQPAPPGSANGDDRGWGPQLLGASRCVEGDDEDGVTFMTPLLAGSTACLRLHATQPGYVNAFSDFTGDGVLAPLLFTHQDGAVIAAATANNAVAAGSHAYCFAVPPTTNHAGLLYSRFRLSSSGGLAAVGAAADGSPADGEVEDYVQPLACVGNFVWDDHNGNGRQEPGESGMANVTVNLLWGGLDGDLQTVADNQTFTTQTDAQGAYHFCGLLPTTTPAYQLFLPTLPGVPTRQDASNEESTDSDGDPQGRGPAFALPLPLSQPDNAANDQSYEGYADPQDDLSFDFGFYQLATIGNLVWHDLDQDGLQDPNEPGMSAVLVQLYRSDGTLIEQMITDAEGHYQFTNLPPGEYIVGFEPPPNFTFSPIGGDSASDHDSNVNLSTRQTVLISLQSGAVNLTWDAGLYQAPTALPAEDESAAARHMLYLPLVRE